MISEQDQIIEGGFRVVDQVHETNNQISVDIAVVTDLGDGNDGSIAPNSGLSNEQHNLAIRDVAKPEYRKQASRRWRCVDGRLPANGLRNIEGLADPQIAGGYVIADTSADLMMEVMSADDRHSEKVASKTREAVADGIEVVIHGDDHVEIDEDGNRKEESNFAGCGANVQQRNVLSRNAENADIVIPKAMAVAKAAKIDSYYTDSEGMPSDGALADRCAELIETGARNADNDAYWDTTPAEVPGIVVENGGEYEEVVGEHLEDVAVADCAEGAIDEEQYMRDHVVALEDGTELTLEAFIASIGEYKKVQFELAQKHGRSEKWAADKTLAIILQTIGTVKKLTAKDFPVAVLVPAQ